MERIFIALILTAPVALYFYLYHKYVLPVEIETAQHKGRARAFDFIRANLK